MVSAFGGFLVMLGWEGWTTGEVMLHPRGRQSYLAVAGGPHADMFLLKVWGLLLVGGALVLVGLGMLLYFIFAPRERVAKGLLNVGLQSPTAGSPTIPAWAVVVVLIALFTFLGLIAFRLA